MVKSNTVTISVALAAPVLTTITLAANPTTGVDTNTQITAVATFYDQYGAPMSGKTAYLFNAVGSGSPGYTGLNAVSNSAGAAQISFKLTTQGNNSFFVADNAQGT